MSDNIKVVVKVRPLIRREIEDKLYHQWRVNDNTLIQIDQNGKECGGCFKFDKVYDQGTETSDVYTDVAKPIVEAAIAGFNGTIFAYGQTSSGKTYTMTGTEESPGIIPLAVLNLFDIIKNVPDRDFLVRVSYVEIYNESLIDLLDAKKNLKIHETFQGVKVDATEKLTTSPEEVLQVMKEGTANRQTGATNMNEESSRSHSIFQITIESREHIEGEEEVGTVNVSQLNLVDLAGSERSGQTGVTGRTFKEGTHINKSLSVLALVIKQLSEDPNKHANYRDSKLTRILQNSLGGNAKTSIICAVTPAVVEETISTLQFAYRAKAIKNTPAVNAVATDATMIQSLTKQLSSLKTQLESKKNLEKDNFNLQKQIGNLQRLILNGFSHRSNTNLLSGARRKLHHPRRVTISTLHPIQEDPVPIADSLKYNPVSLNTLPEFLPIKNSSSLSSVAEEPRLISPPPSDRKVYFSDEIIEIDSDDDTSITVQTCSPYHSCYESSKTPPCILRKNAKQAEKNFKDIVELTEREKIYTPNVVELMEKLENTTIKIAELEDNINKLSKSKDEELGILKSKINEAREEINDITSAKNNLETACKDYKTKLTDWEVSYETLQKKFKTREEELLSILHEHRKRDNKIGETSSKAVGRELSQFLDTSRDISLVNSDNETSITCLIEKQSHHMLCSNSELEAQINLKNQNILHLEAKLHAQKLKIDTLENINIEYKVMFSDFKNKILLIENENGIYKSTIDNLNVTIENQKSTIDKAMSDIESLNDVIKDLQIKLNEKENISINSNKSDLENVHKTTDILSLDIQRDNRLNIFESLIDDLDNTIDDCLTNCKSIICINLNNCSNKMNVSNLDDVHQDIEYKIGNLTDKIKTTVQHLTKCCQDKDAKLNEITLHYENKLKSENIAYLQQLQEITKRRDSLLKNVLEKTTTLTSEFGIKNSISCQVNNDSKNAYEQTILNLEKIANYILTLNAKYEAGYNNVEGILSEAKKEIHKLTEENLKLVQDISNLENKNVSLAKDLKNIQNESKNLTIKLQKSNMILNELKLDVVSKSSEIEIIQSKAKEWKDKFKDLEIFMKEQIFMLERENIELKTKCSEWELQFKQSFNSIELKTKFASGDQKNTSVKSEESRPFKSPPSLLTICCNRIIEAIQPNESEYSENSSNTTSELKYCCQCKELAADLNALQKENSCLKLRVSSLESLNECFVSEKEEVQKEVLLLIENSHELQKKIINHRTNLSTLTATTYAENKSLSSQMKFLQHNHRRFHNVCQKDIPTLKSQLQELMILLKSANIDTQNESFKRNFMPNLLDSSLYSKFKNESTFEGDLLMLDTNITLTTCDNTVMGQDQTSLDVTQVCAYSEVACQTSVNDITNCNLLHSQMEMQSLDDINESLKSLTTENHKLRDLVNDYYANKNSILTNKINNPEEPQSMSNEIRCLDSDESVDLSQKCKCKDDILVIKETHKIEMDIIANQLIELKSQKHKIEEKYLNLTLEVPSTELLVKKLNALENECETKRSEIIEITQILNKKNEQLKHLLNENETLSNQVMESISELDDLKKEYDLLKEINCQLTENHSLLSKKIKSLEHKSEDENKACTECTLKNEIITTLKNNLSTDSRMKLDRSYSDSESSSRYNKICTLQNELHAGKEDCIELKEEVTTIKNHLERSNLSINQGMDLDESIRNSHIYSFDKEFGNIHPQENTCKMANTTEQTLDEYSLDKEECLAYVAEKVDANGGNLPFDMKLIDIMKMLYDNMVLKHSNDIENLINKLRDFEESKNELQKHLKNVQMEHIRVTKELDEKNNYFQTMASVVSHIRKNIDDMSDAINISDVTINFKDRFLKIIDKEFGLASTQVFEIVIQQLHQIYDNNTIKTDILQNDNKKLQNDIQQLHEKLEFVNDSLSTLKLQHTEKEKEFNLLKRQKDAVHEISTAVTLDIVRREQDLRQKIIEFYEFLNKNNSQTEIDLSISSNELIDLLFDLIRKKNGNVIIELESERNKIAIEANNLKTLLELKETELQKLINEFTDMQDKNKHIKSDLSAKQQEIEILISQHQDLNKIYSMKVQENDVNMRTINRLTEEVNILEESLINKDTLITSLEAKLSASIENYKLSESKISTLMESISISQKKMEYLKSINETIIKEKENYSMELDRANTTIKQNKVELDNMATHILALKESVKQTSSVVDKLTQELKSTVDRNEQLQVHFDEKCQDCSRLEMNIKTHEKSAEIQSRMIIRLQNQKEEDNKLMCIKDLKMEEFIKKYTSLQTECELLGKDLKTARDEIDIMKNNKVLLEAQISALEKDALTSANRSRRQSIHESKRMFAEDMIDHKETDGASKSHSKGDDIFMDVDGDSSSRSTPVVMSKGRDSLSSRHDQNENDENHSRSSSVQMSRQRRQSVHDAHRSVRHTPEPHEISRGSSSNNSIDSEVTQLRKQLLFCQQELEELKEKYREVDEECEICAQYLRERDEQCLRLKKEKRVLEDALDELKEKFKRTNPNNSQVIKDKFADASVNTDEDWTNLHSVVVDRMSYDAEVEKNKKLMKLVEELRFKKQDLNNTLVKMQKALEKHAVKEKELEAIKASLTACQRELTDVRERCKELDEECETCAAYLRERDEQCRKLKEAKVALEAKLLEYTDTAIETRSVRKKRQTLHDQRRAPASTLADAATETSDDFLSYQVERDYSKVATLSNENVELKQLKTALEKLSQQKKDLENQLSAGPQYVATGSAIVQGQQITDVMKENQKLKKMNAKLITICKKRGKSLTDSNRENEDPSEQIDSIN